jgi:amino acid adenylation domain-containing protein
VAIEMQSMTSQEPPAETLSGQRDYWRQALTDAPALLTLPTDRPRPNEQSFAGATLPVHFDAALTAALKRLSQQHGSTLFMTVLSAWTALLSRLSGQDDVVIGIPSANRQHHQVESLVGFFVNTLALRIDLSGTPVVGELLERVRRTVLDAQNNQDLPFEQVVDALRPPRNLAHTPIFQVMFAWQDNATGSLSLPGLRIEPAELAVESVKFDLELALGEVDGQIVGQLAYATDLFDRETLERHVGYLLAVLRAMAADVDGKSVVAQIPLLGDAERRLLLDTLNSTEFAYPQERCLHALFEDQVSKAPDATAVVFGGESLSYRELNVRANRLAHHLIELGVGPDRRVALCLDRSISMVVGLLAILKAGGAYVPLDPTYPRQRLEQMLADAGVTLLLTDAVGRNAIGEEAIATTTIVDLDLAAIYVWDACADSNPDPQSLGLTSRHLAYVIYTSGSTGIPKGAQNEHHAIVNRLLWMQHAYSLTVDDVVLQKTPFSFDVSVWEFFWTLLSGATLVLAAPEGHKDPDYLIRLIAEQGVTTAHFVPSMLSIFLDANNVVACTSLRRVVCSGEALAPSTAQKCKQSLPLANLYNLYGPTEAAVDVTAWTCPDDFKGSVVPIGKPIHNTRIYLLDPHGAPVPLGVTGELYIGGAGVARGYLNRPELTAERFIDSPFVAGDRLYRTGDLARYLPDGNIEYLGRTDHQVKIRGFRIELGEIEAVLCQQPGVRQAVVIDQQDGSGNKRLLAYLTAEAGEQLSVDSLRKSLRLRLPDYMIPAALVVLEHIPLSANGKVDRRALPEPDIQGQFQAHYVPPRTNTERVLAQIWSQILKLPQVGIEDNFFDLGGHSLLLMSVTQAIKVQLDRDMNIVSLFKFPTVAELAKQIDEKQVGESKVEERKNEHQQLVERISRQRSASVVRNRETREASALHASTNISTSTIIGDRHE